MSIPCIHIKANKGKRGWENKLKVIPAKFYPNKNLTLRDRWPFTLGATIIHLGGHNCTI